MKAGRSLIRPSGRSARIGLFAVAIGFGFLGSIASSTAVTAGPPVEKAKISQTGRSFVIQVRTAKQVALKDLERQPDLNRPRADYLCLEMTRKGRHVISRLCLGGRKDSHHKLGVTRASRRNEIYSKATIKARVKRAPGNKLVVTIDPADARLTPDRYRWRVVYSDGECRPDDAELSCRSSFPARHLAEFEMKRVQAVGCSTEAGGLVTHGPRGRKRVALTFDDGPSAYTPDVLGVLERKKVKATFFMLGQEVSRYPSTARRVLAKGHELANHSTSHSMLPGYADIRHASAVIKDTTGFRPCLFRPPYGAANSGLIANARAAGMATINWDRDTTDWQLPGSGHIASVLSSAGPGSIVLMHDGGGPRSQTVDALESGIDSLRHRGYEFVTVTDLLGGKFKYRPVP